MLTFRDRLAAFPIVALPALSAFFLGRLLAHAGQALQGLAAQAFGSRPLPVLTEHFFRWAAAGNGHGSTIESLGGWMAVAISVGGFFIVHRLPPERAFRALVFHLSVAWGLQVAVLMLALVAIAAPWAL
jgi:hypothetical protein